MDSRYNIAVIGAAMQSNGCVGFAQLADTAFVVEIL
jgi:hypothetical protein